jgi:hypothetical protein
MSHPTPVHGLPSNLARLQTKWLRLWDGRPGRRFQNYYRRTRQEVRRNEGAPRIVRLCVAAFLFLVGVALILFPAIYVPFFVASAALFASESLPLARLLDRIESGSRHAVTKFMRRFGLSRKTVKYAALTLSLSCLALTGCACYSAFVR